MATYCVNHIDKGADTYVIGSTAFATCNTAGGTPGKTVALNGFKLLTGATVFIKFAAANTATNPTLNVNQTGAKSITNPNWASGCVRAVTYDGTNWVLGDLPVTEKGAKKVKLTGAVTGEASVDSNGTITVDTTKNHTHTKTDITDWPKSKGNQYQPVYFDANGNATPITCTIKTDVPTGAKFTDTTYGLGWDTTNKKITLVASGTTTSMAINYATTAGIADSALVANKLPDNVDVGGATNPVYFEDGLPKACTHTLEQSVTSTSKLTDTTYSLTTSSTTIVLKATGGTDSSITAPYATAARNASSDATTDTNVVLRNIKATTETDPSVSGLSNGDIILVYE